MQRLHLAIAPAYPQDCRQFIAGQPAITRGTSWRQRDARHPAMQTLLGVVLDRRPQVLEVPARTTTAAALPHVIAAGFARHFGQRLAAPIVVEPTDAGFKLRPRRLSRASVVEVDG